MLTASELNKLFSYSFTNVDFRKNILNTDSLKYLAHLSELVLHRAGLYVTYNYVSQVEASLETTKSRSMLTFVL